jgi:hypothetical protein
MISSFIDRAEGLKEGRYELAIGLDRLEGTNPIDRRIA